MFRYSPVDTCNYELVDMKYSTAEETKIVKKYDNMTCKQAFDQCAIKRDTLNKNNYDQRFICAEKVDETIQSENFKETIPSMIDYLDKETRSNVKSFLKSTTPKSLFKIGKRGGYKGCKIVKSPICNYQVKVNGVSYPKSDGSVCSSNRKSNPSLYGCEAASQKVNAACLLALAISEGYCI